MPVTIKIEGLDKVLKGIKNYSDDVQKNVTRIVKEGAERVRNEALRRVPVNEGFLKQSIQVDRIPSGYEVVVGSDYAPYVEFGTKGKTRVPSEFASYAAQFKGRGSGGDMYQSILDWVKLKRIRFEVRPDRSGKRTTRQRYLTPEQTAFIIMNSIRREGIDAQPYLLPAFVVVREDIIKQIVKELRK